MVFDGLLEGTYMKHTVNIHKNFKNDSTLFIWIDFNSNTKKKNLLCHFKAEN